MRKDLQAVTQKVKKLKTLQCCDYDDTFYESNYEESKDRPVKAQSEAQLEIMMKTKGHLES